MKTKKITLYYSVETRRVLPPGPGDLERKDQWLREVQATVEADWKPLMVKVTYEVTNPETEQQRKFFNGPVVAYWAIQSQELLGKEISPELKKQARETLLDIALGYDVELVSGKARRRKSTTDFIETQQWHDFLETLRETEFDPNGYEFPDSGQFWTMAKIYGYDKAHAIAIEQLQKRLQAKLGDLSTEG